MATGFIIWLTGLASGKFLFGKLRAWCASSRWLGAMLVVSVMAAATVWSLIWWPKPTVRADWEPAPCGVLGTAKGIYPGRVVWVRDPNATRWDGASGHWWDDYTGIGANTNGTDQTECDGMLSWSLRTLTGATNDAAAWDAIFRYYNSTHGRGDLGYAAGEKIAIKVNLNNIQSYQDTDNSADALPHTVLAMLRQLINQAGVAQSNITVYEAPDTAPFRVIPDYLYNKCHGEFPSVVFADCTGTNGRVLIQWATNAISYSVANQCGQNLPTVVTNATYLINLALLKGHAYTGFTLTAKNWYGSINNRDHYFPFVSTNATSAAEYSPFVDLMGSLQLGGKTILFMIDGLYGAQNHSGSPVPWYNLFGGQWSASYFASLDPVAVDSVGMGFLLSEFGDALSWTGPTNCDLYLREAALADNPPSGTVYTNDLGRLASLGTHERWNNCTNMLYSRNLGTGTGIELVANTDANLILGIAASPSTPTAGFQQTYVLTVTNAGPADATGVTLTNVWPMGATFVSATASQGSCVTNSSAAVIANLGVLAAANAATVQVVVAFPTTASGIATNSATVFATQRDAYLPDNLASVTGAIQVDSVGDGIPNGWRAEYFPNVDPTGTTTNNLSCATCDADGTGQNNLFKYVAGLDPTNPASVFTLRIAAVPGYPTQKNLMYQPVASAHTYVVQSVTNLVAGVWSVQATSAPFTNGTQVTVTDPYANTPGKFYRVDIYNILTNINIIIEDSVGDGIPDSWRARYFANQPTNNINGTMTNSQSCATCDADGTGQNNLFKFLAGFNPTNPAAYLHVISIATTNTTDINVIYLGANGDSTSSPAIASRTNILEYSTGTANGSYNRTFLPLPSAGATNILSGGTGTGIVTNMVDAGGATNTPSRYYRVRVLVP